MKSLIASSRVTSVRGENITRSTIELRVKTIGRRGAPKLQQSSEDQQSFIQSSSRFKSKDENRELQHDIAGNVNSI